MPNSTIEDFRIAVKAKYEIVKEGEDSNCFNPPSPANLRKLCLKMFRSINNRDDLDTFFLFFGFDFDGTKKNLFKDDLNKFKPIGAFFKGDTINPTDETVYFAAILVDFQPRPFNRFRREMDIERNQTGNSKDRESSGDVEEINEGCNKPQSPVDEKEEKNEDKNTGLEPSQKKPEETKGPHPFKSFIEKICQKFTKRVWWTMFVIALVFACGFLISHFVFPEKQCMQWNKDHYDIVSCDLEVNGMVTLNGIEPLDMSRVSLRKIKVCDTTTFFKNGQAIVFYAKNGNLVECFNQMAKNPENTDQYLKPITKHIIDEHLSNKPCK